MEANLEPLQLQPEIDRRRMEAQRSRNALLEVALAQDLMEEKQRVADRLPPEPGLSVLNCVTLRAFLPSGTMVRRRFLPDSLLQTVWMWVYLQQETPLNFCIYRREPRQRLQGIN